MALAAATRALSRVATRGLHTSAPVAAGSNKAALPKSIEELKKEYPYSVRLDVDFCDLDAMVHVNNTVYFRWFETLRVRQFSQEIYPEFSFTPEGHKPVIAETWCRYRRPIELYDVVTVACRVRDLDQARGEFKHEYAVWSEKQATVAAVGGCTIVVCDFDKGGARTAIPDDWIPRLVGGQ